MEDYYLIKTTKDKDQTHESVPQEMMVVPQEMMVVPQDDTIEAVFGAI